MLYYFFLGWNRLFSSVLGQYLSSMTHILVCGYTQYCNMTYWQEKTDIIGDVGVYQHRSYRFSVLKSRILWHKKSSFICSSTCILMYFIYCYWNRIINQRGEEKYEIFQVRTQKNQTTSVSAMDKNPVNVRFLTLINTLLSLCNCLSYLFQNSGFISASLDHCFVLRNWWKQKR